MIHMVGQKKFNMKFEIFVKNTEHHVSMSNLIMNLETSEGNSEGELS